MLSKFMDFSFFFLFFLQLWNNVCPSLRRIKESLLFLASVYRYKNHSMLTKNQFRRKLDYFITPFLATSKNSVKCTFENRETNQGNNLGLTGKLGNKLRITRKQGNKLGFTLYITA